MTKTQFKIGDRALSRDGHPVEIVGLHREGEVDFAVVRYLDGHLPYDPNGRAAGSYNAPLWEHRVYDGMVVRPGGNYYRDEDWIVEGGLA